MTQLSFDLEFRAAYGRDDFIVGRSNEMAIRLIDRWPDWDMNPFLIVYGDEGSGKKHLASVWQKKSSAIVFSPEAFSKTDLLDILNAAPNIILYNLHEIVGNAVAEEKLFHIYNHYKELSDRKFVLITSRFAPSELNANFKDVQSRLNGSMTVKIDNPDDMLLMQVLGKQLHDRGFQPTEDLLRYAVKLMERSWTAPKRLAEILNKMSLDAQKGLTKRMIGDAISQIETLSDQDDLFIPPAAGKLSLS